MFSPETTAVVNTRGLCRREPPSSHDLYRLHGTEGPPLPPSDRERTRRVVVEEEEHETDDREEP